MLEQARRKLIFWNIGVVVSLLAAVVFGIYFSFSKSIEDEVASDLTTGASAVRDVIRYVPQTGTTVTPAPTATPGVKKEKDKDDDHDGDETGGRLETGEDLRLNISNLFYFVTDAKGTVVANPRQITSKALPDLSSLNRVMQGQSFFRELKLENDIPVRIYSTPIRLDNGRIVGMLQVGKNLALHQEQLRNVLLITGLMSLAGITLAVLAAFFLTSRALVPVRLSIQRQREFVADASHELRTPLALIQANTEMALRHKNKTIGQSVELLEDIRQETEYLTRLVSDLLTLARADTHKLEYKPEPVELKRLAQEATRQVRPLADAKQLELKFMLESNEPEFWLHGDPLRLKQLLIILLDNAIKYTSAGEVQLTLGRGHHHDLIIKVKDTGIGIPQDKLNLIFERFYRVDKARSRSEGGFGLGLAIARWIVDAHKGTIQATSQPGQGSTFTINLPTGLPAQFNRN